MNFYFIGDKSERSRVHAKLLQNACVTHDVKFNYIDAEKVSYFDLPELDQSDSVYRHSVLLRAKLIEQTILNDKCKHFYLDWRTGLGRRASSFFLNEKYGVPVIPTIPFLPTTPEEVLRTVDFFDTFPVIIKVMGYSNGGGVIKIDSIESFKSIIDYLRITGVNAVVRKFVPHRYYGRLVVLDGKIIGSHKTIVPAQEFRSNTIENVDSNRISQVFSEEVESAAVLAVSSLGLKFGGVDVLFDENQKFYISEVNFPCAFRYTHEVAGVDVASLMIEYLKNS